MFSNRPKAVAQGKHSLFNGSKSLCCWPWTLVWLDTLVFLGAVSIVLIILKEWTIGGTTSTSFEATRLLLIQRVSISALREALRKATIAQI